MLHKNVLAGDVHILHNWSVADTTARDALTVAATDVGKVCQVTGTSSYYILTDDSPMTWQLIGSISTSHDAVTLNASVADILGLTTQEITADDAGADKIVFWDDSESKLTYLALQGLSISTTNLVSTQCIAIACSDETTALTTGTAKATFRMPYAFTLTAVRASVTTAPTGATLNVDINESGVSVLSTVITIDASEKTSTTAATPPVISDTSLADDAEITIDIDQVGSTIAGAGLKVYLIGYKT